MITILDRGGANLASIQFALKRLGARATLSSDAQVLKKSSHVILPGVGSAKYAMNQLKELSLIETIQSLTQPVLGICLGMQLLFDFSEEGNVECLKIVPGSIKKIIAKNKLSVPHMGWNRLNLVTNDLIMKNIPDYSYMYFVHSYHAAIFDYTTTTTSYGELFSASIQYKNFFGVQFHPERSGPAGSKILKNFLEL